MTLGQFLRQEREKKGFTIEQVASATKISVKLLHLLEDDRYTELPAKPFIRGFVHSYARFIGLNESEIMTQYRDFLEEKSKERPVKDEGHSGYAFERKEGEQNHIVLWSVLGTFVAFGLIAMLVFKPSFKRHKHHDRDKGAEVVVVSDSPSGLPSALPSPSPSSSSIALPSAAPSALPSVLPSPEALPSKEPIVAPKPSPAPKPKPSEKPAKPDPLNSGANLDSSKVKFKIVAKALEDVRVRYKSDDRPLMKFILRKDRVVVVRAEERIQFQCSHPDQIEIKGAGPSKVLSEHSKAEIRSGAKTLVLGSDSAKNAKDDLSEDGALESDIPAPRNTAP